MDKVRLKPSDLQKICCNTTLFENRSYRYKRWYIALAKAHVAKTSTKQKYIQSLNLNDFQTRQTFFEQIRSISFNHKVLAKRKNSKELLEIASNDLKKLQKRQEMLRQGRRTYYEFIQAEKQKKQ